MSAWAKSGGEHDLVSGVRMEYSHNSTNQLVSKQTYSNGQKPWVKGSLNEPGHVNLGAGPVAVKADGSFEGQSPTRTTTITAKDSAGNTTTETWQLNSGSGATPDATFNYTHDSEGNLMGDGTSSFEWDLRNRLTAIVTGTHRTEFTYDGSDRRVRVVEKESGTVTSDLRYIFHGLSLLEERASDNSTVLRRFYAGGHVDVANGGTRYAYTADHLGSIREVMELDGTSGNPTTATLAARYDYGLWGKRTVLDGGSAAETLVMHGYTGHVYHKWSGLWLAPYRAYNSGLGRWISSDPIAEDGGINLYGYVGNDPMQKIDKTGEFPWLVAIGVGYLVYKVGSAFWQLAKASDSADREWQRKRDAMDGWSPKNNCPVDPLLTKPDPIDDVAHGIGKGVESMPGTSLKGRPPSFANPRPPVMPFPAAPLYPLPVKHPGWLDRF